MFIDRGIFKTAEYMGLLIYNQTAAVVLVLPVVEAGTGSDEVD